MPFGVGESGETGVVVVGRFEVVAQVLEQGAARWDEVARGLVRSHEELIDLASTVRGSAQEWSPELCAEVEEMAAQTGAGAVRAYTWADHLRALADDVSTVDDRVAGDVAGVWR